MRARRWAPTGAVALLGVSWAPLAAVHAQVPDPSSFHGYESGTRYTITSGVIGYYRALAAASPRVEYTEYGRSIQGRPLVMLTIGSERNLARRDEIQANMLRLTGVTERLPGAELSRLAAEMPAVVWICIVDTDEEAGVEALQELAYELATREDEEARSIRENVLVIMTPLTNPDSQARYVMWHDIYDVDGAATDPFAVENEPHWAMNTDGNAWGIDVNRDFGWFVTPEMGALAKAAMEWRPEFWLDIHSGPRVISLPPFSPPFHPLWQPMAMKWWEAVAQRANQNFGRAGVSFSSRKDYEGHTETGVGRSWAMVGPSVSGFLYESFGGRPGMTTAFIRTDGSVATMRMAMDRHKLGVYSLLEVARDRRAELVRDAHERVVQGVEAARANRVKGVAIPASGPDVDPDKVARLVERLTLQEVEVRRIDAPATLLAEDFFDMGRAERRVFPAGSYVVDFVQPQARLARALLDPTVDLGDPTVEVPFDRKMPYYDVSWGSLALLFGVPTYALTESVGELGRIAEGPAPRQGRVEGLERSEPPYGYVLPAGLEASYRVAVRLMREGYRVRVFTDPTQIRGEDFPKGTFGIIRSRNPEGLDARLAELAREEGARVVAVVGPYTEGGLTFGDDARVAAIPKPLVAVLADWPVTHDHTYGGIRSTLEGDFRFPFSPVMLETINAADLSKYTAVVLPHAGMDMRGGPNFNQGYRGRLNLENLRRYVVGGGTLVVTKGAAVVVAEDPVLGAGVGVAGWAEHTSGPSLRTEWVAGMQPPPSDVVRWRPGLDEVGLPLLAAGRVRREFASPGVYPILLDVDESAGAEVVARYSANARRLVLDGFMLEEDWPTLAGRPFLVVQRAGRGRVVYFADEPTFRGFWYGLNTTFLDALLFGPIL